MGLVCATSHMLGLQSILLDWRCNSRLMCGWTPQLGIAIGSRRGLGRLKHIDTVFLVQAMVPEGKISLGKKPTKEMLADFLTKHVDAATMQSCKAGYGMGPVRREQANPESVILSSDRDDCCAGDVDGYLERGQSEFFNVTWRCAGQRPWMNKKSRILRQDRCDRALHVLV